VTVGARAALAALLLSAVAACPGCGDDPIDVHTTAGDEADYNRGELNDAVGRFVAAGRTVEAYGVLAREVTALRPGMDETVADLAELQLVILALAPVEAARTRPASEQTALLATTVWPIALAPAIEVLAADGWRDPSEAPVVLGPGETAEAYVRRLCDTAYAVECRHVAPEWQGAILGSEAIARMTQRARTAVANCEECTDAAWKTAVGRWEVLDRAASTDRRRFEELGATSRWPVAGPGAVVWPTVPVVEIEPDGDWMLDGTAIDPRRRGEVLRELRGGGRALGVHLVPGARLEALENALAIAGAAGYAEIALQAREPVYPWALRAYQLPTKKGKRARLGRVTDTVQVYLRAVDAQASAGGAAAARRP
jgi:hypothetical protein